MLKIAILMPTYEDYASAKQLVKELACISDFDISILIVDDGSLRHPLSIDVFDEAQNMDGIILSLSRNVGHQAAIATGLTFLARSKQVFDAIIVMDSDGEDDPSRIPDLVALLQIGDTDVVVARRGKRSEGLAFRIFYYVYRFIFLLFTGKTINFGNFMALNQTALERIVEYNSLWTHFAATIVATRLRLKYLIVDRKKRYFGESKMNFFSLCLHGFRALMVFSDDVLVRVGVASATVAVVSIVLATVAGLLKLADIATPGWFSIAVGILFLVFLQTGALTLISLLLSGKGKRDYVIPDGLNSLIKRVLKSQYSSKWDSSV